MNITQEPTVLTYVADLEELHHLIVEMKTELTELKTQHDEHFKKLIGVTPEVPTQPELPKVNGAEKPKVRHQGKLNARKKKPAAVEAAMDYFKKELADGPKNAKKFRAEAHAKHHFRDALKEAEKNLFIVSCWRDGEMCYAMPDHVGPSNQDSRPTSHFRMPAHDPLTYEDLKNGLFSSLCHAYLVGPERSKLGNKFRGSGYVAIYSQSLDLFRDGNSIREIRKLQPNAAGDPIGSQGMVRRVVKAIHHFGTPQEKSWLFKPNRRVDGLNS